MPTADQLVYFRPGDRQQARVAESARTERDVKSELRQVSALHVGGREWHLLCVPTAAYLAARSTWQPRLLLAIGLFLTSVSSLYLLFALAAAERSRRTAPELLRANQNLEREVLERTQTEQRLCESEGKYRLLVEHQTDLVVKVDPKGRFLFVSPSVCRAFGMDEEDLLGEEFWVIAPQHGPRPEEVDELFRSPYRCTLEHLSSTTHGQRWFSWACTSVVNNHGKVDEIVIVGRDITESRQAEETERASNSRNRTLIEALPQKVFHKDVNSVYVACNENYARDLGIAPAELPGRTDYDFYPRELADKYRADDRAVMSSGKTEEFDEAYPQDGEARVVHTVKTPVTDEAGNVIGILGIFWDITERKQAEEALRQSREQLQALLENVGIGIALISPQMEILELNRQMRHWFPKVDPAQKPICYRAYNDPPRDTPCDYCPTIRTLQDGQVHESVAETSGGDTLRHYRIVSSAIRGEDGKVVAAIEMVDDITESKRAERELRRLAMIAEQAAEGIAVASLEGVLQYVNAAWAQMHGYEPEEMIGKHLSVCHNKEQLELDVIPFNEQVARDGYRTGEVGHVRRDGTPFPTRMIVTVFRDEAGVPTGLIGFASDITHQKQAEDSLAAAYRGLEEVNEELRRAIDQTNQLAIEAEMANVTKSQFLANMSHEIRTPMNAIVGMVELALDTKLTAEQREYLITVKDSAESLLGLLNDVLDVAKIEAGKLELETIDFHLRDSLSDALKTLAIRAHQKGLELAFEVDPDVPDVLVGDPMRLRQIVTNLVGNAIKLTAEGQVVVHASTESESEERACLHFSVTDTGIGIPAEKRDAVFAAFEQADGSATRRYGGTGLGLAICVQLVTAMGGRIWLESEVGKGSTFHFSVALGVPKSAPAPLHPQPVNLQGMSALVVDDNATNRRILEQMLTNWEMKPQAVDGGREAISAMKEAARSGHPFVVLLVDVQMPGMDGFSLVERMRQEAEVGNPAILMLTSSGQRGDAARCRELGISAYLTKPVKQSELWDALMLIFGAQVMGEDASPLITRHLLRENRRRLRILLAEDNAVNQKVAVRMLEKRGHYVTVVGNGTEALAAVESQPFDLVLMDVQMPEMDGLEATAAIREQEKTSGQHLPIIAMTAHAMEGDRERCLAAGMDGYVPKPVASHELFAAIDGLAAGIFHPQEGLPMPSGERKLLDEESLLARVDGDLELLKELIQGFLEERPNMVAAISDALAHEDAKATERAAHALKGVLGVLGATSASEAALALEALGRRGDLTGSQEAWDRLEEELGQLEPVLTALRDHGLPVQGRV